MGDSTAVPASESIPNIEVTPSEVIQMAKEESARHQRSATFVLYALVDAVRENGIYECWVEALDVIKTYRCCISEVMAGIDYLASREVIQVEEEQPKGTNQCFCDTCRARRTSYTFMYNDGDDSAAVYQRKRHEYDLAQRAAVEAAERSNRRGNVENRRGSVYLLRSGGRYKIGITTNLNQRLSQLRSHQPPFPIDLIHSVIGPDYYRFEQSLHEAFAPARVHGEWFDLNGDQVAAVIEVMNEWQAKHAPMVITEACDVPRD